MTTNSQNPCRVTIVGGGISGLSLAFFLKSKSNSNISLSILEASSKPGGTIQTFTDSGYRIETGPNGFLDNRPTTWEIINALGLNDKIVRASRKSNHKYIWDRGKLKKVPEGIFDFLFSDLLSPRGKFRIFLEPFVAPRLANTDESLASFLERRIGKEAMAYLAAPAFSGIYAGSLDELSAEAVLPRLVSWEKNHGSLVKGFLASKKYKSIDGIKTKHKHSRPVLTSFKDGMATLIHALSNHLRDSLIVSTRLLSVERADDQTYALEIERANGSVQKLVTDVLILATPTHASKNIAATLSPELAQLLDKIPYAGIHVVALGFSKKLIPRKLDGFGFLVAQPKNCDLLGCLWSSSMFPNHAPPDKVLLRCMLGGASRPDLRHATEDQLAAAAQRELRTILAIEEAPEYVRVFKWPQGIPQYTIGHSKRLERIQEILDTFPGFFLTGNAYRGIGLNDCIEQSKYLSKKIVEYLTSRKPEPVPKP